MAPRLVANRIFLLVLLLALVGCDHTTKFVAKSVLEHQAPAPLIAGVLDLRYVENTDIAFNLLRFIPEQIRMWLLIAVGAAAVAVLSWGLFRFTATNVAKLALLLVTAGAIGNYADRVLRGSVVDFIHLTHWPVFNVADIYVSLGGLALVLLSLRARQRARLATHGSGAPPG